MTNDEMMLLEEIASKLIKVLNLPKQAITEDMLELVVTAINGIPNFIVTANHFSDKFEMTSNGIVIISYSLDNSISENLKFILNSLCYGLLNIDDVKIDTELSKGNIMQDDEANYLSRAITLPKDVFVEQITNNSTNDGYVNVTKMAKQLKMKDSFVVRRGRDLKFFN